MTKIATFITNPRTNTDVRMLLTYFDDIKPDGRLISHVDLERMLAIPRDVSRYRTTINKVRKILFEEKRVWLDGRAAEGYGYKALTADEMVRFANREVRLIGRKLKRALLVGIAPTDAEITDPANRAYRARLISATEQIAHAHGRVLRELGQALRPPRQLRSGTQG